MEEKRMTELTHGELLKVAYMKKEDLLQLPSMELKRIIITDRTAPASKRLAAIILFDRGEKVYAINFLISQMEQYKDPLIHKNIKFETCPEAARVLGRLQDRRAIEPLFEALGELAYGAAYGLAKINGTDVENRLFEISKSETKEGVYAAIALGLMRNEKIVRQLIDLLENFEKIRERISDIWIKALDSNIMNILGSYKNVKEAEDAFRKYLNKHHITSILTFHLVQNDHPDHRETEWLTATNYGWDKYIDTDAKKFALSFRSISWWDTDYKTPCPFKTDTEIEKLREEVVENIWREMKSDELRS